MAELSTVARPYAEAVFASARAVDQAGQTDSASGLAAWSARLAEMAAVAAHPEVRATLADPRITPAQRIDIFTGLIKSELPQAAQNFIALLVENDRLLLLPEIAAQFAAAKDRHDGVAVAEIASAYALDDAQVKELLAALAQKFGSKLTARLTVDPALIGGVRVAVGDQVLDTSVRAQLTRLADTLAAA